MCWGEIYPTLPRAQRAPETRKGTVTGKTEIGGQKIEDYLSLHDPLPEQGRVRVGFVFIKFARLITYESNVTFSTQLDPDDAAFGAT